MAKRYHKSERMHQEYDRSYKVAEQRPPKFNDESRHDKSPMRMGPYPYDRQPENPAREYERASYRHGNRISDGFYAGAEPRRRQEMMDAGMIHEDHAAVANLPQNVKMSYYPKDANFLPENLDDTIMGVDRQLDYDNGKKLGYIYPKKV